VRVLRSVLRASFAAWLVGGGVLAGACGGGTRATRLDSDMRVPPSDAGPRGCGYREAFIEDDRPETLLVEPPDPFCGMCVTVDVGQPVACVRVERDARGRETRRSSTNVADGGLTIGMTTTYVDAPDGALRESVRVAGAEVVTVRVDPASGERVEERTHAGARVSRKTLDRDGRVLRVESDAETLDVVWQNGRVVEERRVDRTDGGARLRASAQHTYSADGCLEEVRGALDGGDDDRVYVIRRDRDGAIVHEGFRVRNNGTETDYTRADGRLVLVRTEHVGILRGVRKEQAYTYDGQGRTTAWELRGASDERPLTRDFAMTYSYSCPPVR
jgi:hypothetical protein